MKAASAVTTSGRIEALGEYWSVEAPIALLEITGEEPRP